MKTKLIAMRNRKNRERGSVALEHVLFIGAVVAVMTGVLAFYTNMGAYFSNVSMGDAPQNVGDPNG